MTIGLIFLMALASVAGALILLIRLVGWRRVLRHATLIDIGFTVLVCFALAGTLTGLLIGIVAGLVMTGTLAVAKAAVARADGLRLFRDLRWERRNFPHRFTDPTPAAHEEDWCPGGTARSL